MRSLTNMNKIACVAVFGRPERQSAQSFTLQPQTRIETTRRDDPITGCPCLSDRQGILRGRSNLISIPRWS